jgi:hypothetical protein
LWKGSHARKLREISAAEVDCARIEVRDMSKTKMVEALMKSPEGPECLFDDFVKHQLLCNPSTLKTRFDVLMAVFILTGKGYYWENGLISSMSGNRKTVEQAEEDFFHQAAQGTAEYNRRKLQLEQLNLVCIEPRYQSGGHVDALEMMAGCDFSSALATNVPDNAEPSFRRGAIEAMREASDCLKYADTTLGIERAQQMRRAMKEHIRKNQASLPKVETENLMKALRAI